MSRIAYVNGRYLPLAEAAVHIEDRGFQFADAVYDVIEVRGGRLVEDERHLARLGRSLGELRIATPMTVSALGVVIREVVRRNHVRDGLAYVQVTRGVAPRDHAFPVPSVRPTLVVTARRSKPAVKIKGEAGITVVTVPETRWARVDIKTVSLLPNVLARQAAREAGANEAWFVGADGLVNEGSSSNAWIVTAAGELVTAPTTAMILRGVTRAVLLEVAATQGLTLVERRFSVAEALAAREAFITSATSLVTPVLSIDGAPVGNGGPGATAATLRAALIARTRVAPAWGGPVAQGSGIG
ncbi:MAG: D-amino-acid transaminase [Bauldia sp.]|nr:D-amino-acid transaminase [Bauldia sp.]